MPLGKVNPKLQGKGNVNLTVAPIASFPKVPILFPTCSGTSTTYQLSIGDGAVVSDNTNNNISIGQSNARGGFAIAIGIGDSTSTYGAASNGCISLGYHAFTYAQYDIAMGYAAKTNPVSGNASVSIGQAAQSGHSGVAIGQSSVATGNAGSVSIGAASNASGAGSVVIGYNATDNGASSSVVIGPLATCQTGATTISIGYAAGSGVNGSNGVAIGASANGNGQNEVTVGYSSGAGATQAISVGYSVKPTYQNAIGIGSYAACDFKGEINICNARFVTQGDIATAVFPYYGYTTSATPLELQTSGGSVTTNPGNYIALSNNAAYSFNMDLVAQVQGGALGNMMVWNIQFAIQQGAAAANTQLVGTPIITVIAASAGAVSGGWSVAVTADTTNGRPAIKVTGQASTNISWVANTRMTKVGY